MSRFIYLGTHQGPRVMEAIDVKIDAEKRFAVCVDFGGVLHCRTMLVTIEAAEVVQQ